MEKKDLVLSVWRSSEFHLCLRNLRYELHSMRFHADQALTSQGRKSPRLLLWVMSMEMLKLQIGGTAALSCK
jgi:hypothetical protein